MKFRKYSKYNKIVQNRELARTMHYTWHEPLRSGRTVQGEDQ